MKKTCNPDTAMTDKHSMKDHHFTRLLVLETATVVSARIHSEHFSTQSGQTKHHKVAHKNMQNESKSMVSTGRFSFDRDH